MDINLIINGQEWGKIPEQAVPALQFYCSEHKLQFIRHDNNTVEVTSSLRGKKVFIEINTETKEIDVQIFKALRDVLKHLYIDLNQITSQDPRIEDGDLLIELVNEKKEVSKKTILIGLNNKLVNTDFKEIIQNYSDQISFNGYNLLLDNHGIPHIKCKIQSWELDGFFSKELVSILTQVTLRCLMLKKKAHFIDLNLPGLFNFPPSQSVKSSKAILPEKKPEILIDEKEYEAAKQRKKNRKVSVETRKEAEVFFDYNLIPNRKTEKYTIKADFIIKNTGNAVLNNPKICFRVDPPEKIEIGGQILPPEMSEIFSVQGEMGAEGWKYSGKDWLEKAYSTGEYWIEPIQGMELHPGETTGIEGIQFTVDNLGEQETSIILGFVYFEEENLQLSSNNKIMITF